MYYESTQNHLSNIKFAPRNKTTAFEHISLFTETPCTWCRRRNTPKTTKKRRLKTLTRSHTQLTLLHTEHAALVLIQYSTIPIIVEKAEWKRMSWLSVSDNWFWSAWMWFTGNSKDSAFDPSIFNVFYSVPSAVEYFRLIQVILMFEV